MNISVTGATGYIGSNLVARLARKHKIRALIRKSSRCEALIRTGIDMRRVEFSSISDLNETLKDTEIVYHLAGALPNLPLSPREYYSANVETTECLLHACEQTKTLKHFIHCSTAYVCRNGGISANEETIPYPTTIYERSKLAGENIVRQAMGKNLFSITIVRPGFVYGRNAKGLIPLLGAIKKGHFFFLGDGSNLFELTHIDDLLDFFELILKNEKAFDQSFIISEKNPRTFKEIVSIIAVNLGVKSPTLKIPPYIFKIVVELLMILKTVTGMKTPVTRDSYKTLTLNRAFDVTKAERLLNFRTKVTPETGLRDLCCWYLQDFLNKKGSCP